MSHERLFADNLALIEAVISSVCRGHCCGDDEREEFRSLAHIKLIENDYKVLRDHRNRSTLPGYLRVVLENLFRDYRNSKWGKWRPSEEAHRAGEVGELLERLVCRDRHSFDEAVEIIRTNHRLTISRDELWAMLQRFPRRVDRRPAAEETLAYVADGRPLPDEEMQRLEDAEQRRRAYAALAAAVARLEPERRLIVKLRYFDGLKIVDIARALHIDQKRLYRDLERLLAQLRDELTKEGVDPRLLDLE